MNAASDRISPNSAACSSVPFFAVFRVLYRCSKSSVVTDGIDRDILSERCRPVRAMVRSMSTSSGIAPRFRSAHCRVVELLRHAIATRNRAGHPRWRRKPQRRHPALGAEIHRSMGLLRCRARSWVRAEPGTHAPVQNPAPALQCRAQHPRSSAEPSTHAPTQRPAPYLSLGPASLSFPVSKASSQSLDAHEHEHALFLERRERIHGSMWDRH